MKKILLLLLRIYQKTISFDHGVLSWYFPYGYCRFYPSCSMYALSSIQRFGVFSGGVKSLRRLLRCHPFSRGGFDPVA